jgi:hypothetical protein
MVIMGITLSVITLIFSFLAPLQPPQPVSFYGTVMIDLMAATRLMAPL